jgi:hypothetical protein
MGDLVNLRQVRKRKQRDEKAQKADQNRAKHGRDRHERTLTDLEQSKARKDHEGHQRVGASDEAAVDVTADVKTDLEAEVVELDQGSAKGPGNNVVSIFAPDATTPDK